MRAAFLLMAALAAAPFASAQTAPSPAPSLWTDAGGEPAPGAQARMIPGEHGIGDVIAEIPLTPQRSGRLAADVALTDPANGALALSAGTPVRAYPVRAVTVGGGRETPHVIDAGAQWCTESARPVCISKPLAGGQAGAFRYDEYEPGLLRATGRRWSGPEPRIEETSAASASLTRRMVIRTIAVGGVRVSFDEAAGDATMQGALRGLVPYGARVTDTSNELGGIWYSFARVHRRDDTAAERVTARLGLPRNPPGRRG